AAAGGDDAPLGPEIGERRLDDSLLRLSASAGWLADSVPRFRGSCLDARADAARGDAYRGGIGRGSPGMRRALGGARAPARRDGVLPETIRELRVRHHVDEREWDDLAASVERLIADSAGPVSRFDTARGPGEHRVNPAWPPLDRPRAGRARAAGGVCPARSPSATAG